MSDYREFSSAELTEQARQLSGAASHLHTMAIRRKESRLAAREQAMDITGQAQSPDGLVRAVVDVGGMLTDLEIAPEALGLRADHLARVISSVTQEAAGRARAEVRSLYQPLIEEGLVGDLPVLLPGSLPKASATASPPPVDADEDEASFEETFSLRRTER